MQVADKRRIQEQTMLKSTIEDGEDVVIGLETKGAIFELTTCKLEMRLHWGSSKRRSMKSTSVKQYDCYIHLRHDNTTLLFQFCNKFKLSTDFKSYNLPDS